MDRQLTRLQAATERLSASLARLHAAAASFTEAKSGPEMPASTLASASIPPKPGLVLPRGVGPFAELSPAKQRALIVLTIPRCRPKA